MTKAHVMLWFMIIITESKESSSGPVLAGAPKVNTLRLRRGAGAAPGPLVAPNMVRPSGGMPPLGPQEPPPAQFDLMLLRALLNPNKGH